ALLLPSMAPCRRAAQRRELRPFPTRRSSDLGAPAAIGGPSPSAPRGAATERGCRELGDTTALRRAGDDLQARCPSHTRSRGRREIGRHTSELQSRENLVCRLLLEKKKKNYDN